jgi:hypothetical protein
MQKKGLLGKKVYVWHSGKNSFLVWISVEFFVFQKRTEDALRAFF